MMEVNRSCSVTVITGDSESLNPGSIPGRTCFFAFVSNFFWLPSDWEKRSKNFTYQPSAALAVGRPAKIYPWRDLNPQSPDS